MRQVLIHIGTGKTGTRSIQSAMTRLRREDRLAGVCYPDLGGRRDHAMATFPYKPYDRLGRGLRSLVGHDRDRARELADTMRRELGDVLAHHDRVVLSTEFFENTETDGVTRLLDDLHGHGVDRVAVLVYVRDPAGLYVSRMQQQIRASSTIVQPRGFRFGYRRRIEPWDRPGIDLDVRAFDRSRLVAGDVVEDFLAVVEGCFGVEVGRVTVPARNLSMSAEAMILLQRYRLHVHPDADDRVRPDAARLLALVEQLAGSVTPAVTSPRLAPWARDRVRAVNGADLEWLRDRHGVDRGRGGGGGGVGATGDDEPRVERIEEVLDGWRPDVLEALTQAVLARLLGEDGAPE